MCLLFSSTDVVEKRGGRIDETPLSPANNQGSAHTYYNMAAGMYDVFNSCMRLSLTFFSVGIDIGRQNLTSVDVSF